MVSLLSYSFFPLPKPNSTLAKPLLLTKSLVGIIDNFFSKTLPSVIANYIVRLFSRSKIHDHGCAFKIVNKNAIDELTNWGDFHRLLAARLSNNGYKVSEIEVKHNSRIHGSSNYGFGRILKLIIDLLYLNFFKNYKRKEIYFLVYFSFF